MSSFLPALAHGRIAAATLALVLSVPTVASASNLFVNGSFETPTLGYQLVGPGNSTAIPGWTTVLSGVEHFNAAPYGGTPDGTMIVDLANYVYSAGGLEQTVATVAGQTYDVSFWAGNLRYAGRTGTGNILVTVGANAPLTFATPVATTATLVWEQRSFSFVASTNATTIRFWNNQDANVYFADLDGVSVLAAVPEAPAALLMLGGLLAGAWLRRARHAEP